MLDIVLLRMPKQVMVNGVSFPQFALRHSQNHFKVTRIEVIETLLFASNARTVITVSQKRKKVFLFYLYFLI